MIGDYPLAVYCKFSTWEIAGDVPGGLTSGLSARRDAAAMQRRALDHAGCPADRNQFV